MLLFPSAKATLEDDLTPEEIEAVGRLGVLKDKPHLYFGCKIKSLSNASLVFLKLSLL